MISHMPSDGLSFSSCGDLIPSGHIGFTVMGLIAILRALPVRWTRCTAGRGSSPLDRRPLYALSVVYLMTTMFFILAYRKHYSVDLVVGIFLALFMYGFSRSHYEQIGSLP